MNIPELRNGFKAYMQERFPNDSNISSTISMAFFLERYGNELDMDFQRVLSERTIPDSYKQKLESYFISRNRKDPRSNASIYKRSLRLLLEYLDGKPSTPTSKPQVNNKPRTINTKASAPTILRPTKEAVVKYLEKWKQLSRYTEQKEVLFLLFHETYPANTKLSEVLIKCSSLNDFYGTNIYNVYTLAKHIVNLNIDARLADGDT